MLISKDSILIQCKNNNFLSTLLSESKATNGTRGYFMWHLSSSIKKWNLAWSLLLLKIVVSYNNRCLIDGQSDKLGKWYMKMISFLSWRQGKNACTAKLLERKISQLDLFITDFLLGLVIPSVNGQKNQILNKRTARNFSSENTKSPKETTQAASLPCKSIKHAAYFFKSHPSPKEIWRHSCRELELIEDMCIRTSYMQIGHEGCWNHSLAVRLHNA